MALTKKQIDYEIGTHDCGQNPYCNRYRGCSDSSNPIPSSEELEELKVHYRERCIEIINNSSSSTENVDSIIQRWMKEHWYIYYNIKL